MSEDETTSKFFKVTQMSIEKQAIALIFITASMVALCPLLASFYPPKPKIVVTSMILSKYTEDNLFSFGGFFSSISTDYYFLMENGDRVRVDGTQWNIWNVGDLYKYEKWR